VKPMCIPILLTLRDVLPLLMPQCHLSLSNNKPSDTLVWNRSWGAQCRSLIMCDYSLEMYGSRPAREGELYVTTRFPSGSIGFASPGDPRTAVCMQCDTRGGPAQSPVAMPAACRGGAPATTTRAPPR